MNTLLAFVLALLPIIQATVTVNIGETCDEFTHGWYHSGTNTLTICEAATDQQLVFAHELVHAAQDAADGINNGTFKPLLTDEQYATLAATPRGQAVLEVLNDNYEGASEFVLRLEFEAWYAQQQLSDILFD